MIINIRGTSGSGKTTIIRKLLEKHKHNEIWSDKYHDIKIHATRQDRKIMRQQGWDLLGYELRLGQQRITRVVGKYDTPCGGCDGIKTQDETEQRVRQWDAAGYHVIFEGLLISHIYSRWAQLAKDSGNMLFAFLDTPLDVCVKRVEQRREANAVARGKEAKPLDPTNTVQKWHDARRVFARAQAEGLNARWFDGNELYEQLSAGTLLGEG